MTSEGELLAGRYRVDRPLGRGGMAEVWAAVDEVLRRRVALKLFHAGTDDADGRRAVAEMHTLAALSHPNLVTVYDAGRDGARTFLVMELVSGATLADRLDAPGGLDPAEVAVLGGQVAAGLAYIHQRGIVHRDVKPANILLPVRDHVDAVGAKLADFGIAHHAGQERLTQTGMTIGTAQYLAPEQIRGAPVGPPADVYALGLILLEAWGHRPDWTGTPVEIAIARLTRPPEVPAELGPRRAGLLDAMLAADPASRPTAAQVREALATLTDASATTRLRAADATATLPPADATATLPPAGPAPTAAMAPAPTVAMSPAATALLPGATVTPAPTERRRRRWAVAGVLAAAVVAATAVVLVVTGGSGETGTPAAPVGSTAGAATTGAGTTAPVSASSASTAPPTSAAATTPAPATPAPTTPTAADPGPGGTPGGPGGGGPGGGNDKTPPGQTKSKPGKP